MTNRIRVSTKDFTRREGDEVVRYRGDLASAAVRYSRELSFWPWGRNDGSLATGSIEIDNRTGLYDQVVFRDLRDQDLQVKLPTVEGTDIIAITAIVDTTEAPNDRIVRVTLKDTLTLLDVPLQNQVFGDDADESVEGRPLPITLGVVRSIRPPMWEAFPATTGPAYRIHDSAISGIFAVRDKGIILNPLLSPPQYALDGRIGNAGITLETEPVGVVTMDASTSGDAVLPETPTDVLGGNGAFTTSFPDIESTNPNDLTGWVFSGTNPGATGEDFQVPRFSFVSATSGGRLNAGQTQSARASITTTTAVLEAGKTYRWRFTQTSAVGFAVVTGGVIASQGAFRITATTSQVLQDAVTPSNGENLFVRRRYDANNVTGTYSGFYTVPDTGDRYIQMACVNGGFVNFRDVTFIEVPPPPPDELEGITLKDYALEVVRRAGLSDDRIVTADVDAIDPDNAPIGIYLDEPITALGVLRAPLDSYCADIYSDRMGRFRFAQLRDPAEEIHTLTIDANNLADPPRVRIDTAEGLTTSILARRNYYQFRDADFADNPSELPLDLREKLKARGQFQRNAALPEDGLPTVYRHAVEAEPLLSVFDLAADALAQIQRVVDLYDEPRFIVECEVWVEPGQFIELDTIARLVYPRYGFNDGKNFLVVGVTDEVSDQPVTRSVRLRLWG